MNKILNSINRRFTKKHELFEDEFSLAWLLLSLVFIPAIPSEWFVFKREPQEVTIAFLLTILFCTFTRTNQEEEK